MAWNGDLETFEANLHLVGAIKSGDEKDLDMIWSIILSLISLASELGGNWEICTRSFQILRNRGPGRRRGEGCRAAHVELVRQGHHPAFVPVIKKGKKKPDKMDVYYTFF